MKSFRRPSPALIVATVAVLLALGGTSVAAFRLGRNSVGARQLKDGAVITKKLANRAVTAAKLNTDGVTVPEALHAGNADQATTADHATNTDQLGGRPASAFVQAAALQTTPVSFQNGWDTNTSFGVARYATDQSGVVHLFGHASSPTPTTAKIFTLPAGARPGYPIDVPAVFSNSSVGVLRVDPDGSVYPLSGSTSFVQLEGVTFLAGG